MRELTEFCDNWLINTESADPDRPSGEAFVNLPFILSAPSYSRIVFSNSFAITDKLAGETVYLEFRQISGAAEIYNGETLLCEHSGMSASFRVKLTDEATAGQRFDIKATVTPRARRDGNFIFGKVVVLSVGKSHFNLDDCGGPGVYVTTQSTPTGAEVRVKAPVTNPNSHDVVSLAVEDSAGKVVAYQAVKPGGTDTVLPLQEPELWGGQNDAHMYTLKLALLRDIQVLDNLEIPFGIRTFAIRSDKFFRVNDMKLPLNGVMLSDCGHLKTDKMLLDMIDVNALATDSLSARTNLLLACDRAGTVFWFDLPYTGTDADFEDLRDFLRQNRNHPSLAFVCCDSRADADYAAKFLAVCKVCAPEVFTALRVDITDPAPLPGEMPDVIAVTIRGRSPQDDFPELQGRFEYLKNTNPDVSFALFAEAPAGNENGGLSESDLCTWHERLWNTFCRDKSVIGFFAGLLTDTRERAEGVGLVTYDRKYIKDAFWFYKSQFSATAFVKLCAADIAKVTEKKIDVKCYTNTPPAKLTVDGNTKKVYESEELYDGVYVFRKVALKNKVSTLTVSAGNLTDSAQVTIDK